MIGKHIALLTLGECIWKIQNTLPLQTLPESCLYKYAVEHSAKFEVVRYISNLNPEGLQTQDLHGKKIPLHYAAEFGHDHLIPYLLYSYLEGKDVKTANKKTALDLAQQHRFLKVIELLENTEQTVKRIRNRKSLFKNMSWCAETLI